MYNKYIHKHTKKMLVSYLLHKKLYIRCNVHLFNIVYYVNLFMCII